MKNNDTFNTIATLIFKHLYNNFPSPSQLDPEQLISDTSEWTGLIEPDTLIMDNVLILRC